MKKRFLSVMLTLCMVTQPVPTSALAAQSTGTDGSSSADVYTVSEDSGSNDFGIETLTSDDLLADGEGASGEGTSVAPTASADSDARTPAAQSGETASGANDPAEQSITTVTNAVATATSNAAAESTHTHRTCGKSDCTDSAHEEVSWTAWNKADSLPTEEPGATHYYLTTDVTLSSTWYVNSGYAVYLCLNGHTITSPAGDSAVTIAGGQLIITDCHDGGAAGKITHASGATGNGVSVNAGTFTMWNGTITGNTAGFGAGVANYAQFNMYGGSITGNRVNDKAVFDGFGGGVYNCGRLQLSGDVTITDNIGKDGGADNVYVQKRARILVEDTGMSEGAKVGVKSEDPASNPTVVNGSTDAVVFTSDNTNYILQSNGNGGLRVATAHQHNICGKSDCGDEGHDTVEWAMWSSNNSLPTQAGNYYLTTDVTLKDYWLVESNIKLCLNGHTITGANGQDVASVTSYGDLTITDCLGTGKLTHAEGSTGGGISNDGSLTLWGGSICGNSVSSDGAGVRNSGTFTMADGSIENNKSIGDGAGVSNRNGGTFVMTGGKIMGNAVTGSGNGAGVYSDGAFQLSGNVQITGNAGANNAASNVFLAASTSITAIDEIGATSSVGISLASYEMSPVVVTNVSDSSAATCFFADNGSHTIEADGSGNLRMAAHKHRVCGENGCDDENHGAYLTWTSITSLDEIDADGNYYLTRDVALSGTWTCAYNVNLCLNGHTITGADGSPAISVKSGASLALTDCHAGDEDDDSGKITHAAGATGSAIENDGSLTLWGGQITGNTSDYGGAVYNMADATFTMRGGSVAENSAHWGGGVRNDGTATMTGGSIANNTADIAGGGVYSAGTFTLSGDVAIAENKVGAAPNNVYLAGSSVVAVEPGASLSDKASVGITAEKPAAAPTVVTGTTSGTGFVSDDESYSLVASGNNGLKLTSEHVHGVCGAADCGDEGHGNVTWTAWTSADSLPTASGNYYLICDVALSKTWRVESGVDIKLCLNGCDITGPAGMSAVAVAEGASLAITDCQQAAGSITHEKGETGSGVSNSGTFTLWNGSISGNTAADQGQGGGVYNLGTFNMNGGSITGNAASTQGGGVWNARFFNMRGGSITGNTAGGQGGGVYTRVPSYATSADYTIFTMTGGSITGNSVTGSDGTGGGLYASSACYLSGDVEIRGNAQGGTISDGSVSGGTPNNVCVHEALSVASAGMGASAKVGITSGRSGDEPIVVKGTTSTGGFFSDSGSHTLVGDSGEKALRLKSGHHHAVCGQSGCAEGHDENVAWTAWESDNSLPTKAGIYYLTKDVNLTGQWRVGSNVTLCLNGKTITSSYFGAAILVVYDSESSTYGNLTITDCGSGDSVGTITHAAGKVGEAINNQNTLTLWGGQITGNSGSVGAGVYNGTDSTFSVYGGQITGNSGAGVYSSGTIVVAGDARIIGNTTDGTASNVCLINNKPIEVATGGKALSAAAKIGITAQHPDSGENVVDGTTDAGAFVSDNEWYELVEGEGRGLKLSAATDIHTHKICGDDACGDDSHAKLLWHAVSSLADITADGDYYLTGSVKLDDTWTCAYKVNLCLNGHTITGPAGKAAIKVAGGASLAVTDCHEGDAAGRITHDNGETGRGIENGGALALWNGVITGNSSSFLGGGVYNTGTFAINGGSVAGNAGGYGGGVYSDGTLTMAGGAISGNSGMYRGGGVYNTGAMEMLAGSVTGNTAVYYGGGVFDEGTLSVAGKVSVTGNTVGTGDQASANNVFLDRGKAVKVEDAASLDAGSRVGISVMNPSGSPVVVSGSTDTDVFASDADAYSLAKDGSSYLKLSAVPVEVSGAKLLACAGGAEMAGDSESKVYDGQAVAVDLGGTKASAEIAGAEFSCAWQRKSGETYSDLAPNEAPKAAGEYRLVVSYGRNGATFGSMEIPFSITAKQLKVVGITVASKTYDGGTGATVTAVDLVGVVEGDSVGARATSASFTDKNVGAKKSVSAKIELAGDAASNYTVAAEATGKGAITAKQLTVYAVAADKTYDGTTEATVWDVWLDGVVSGEAGQVSVDTSNMAAAFADAGAGENKTVAITGIALAGDGKGNYALPRSVTTDASIYKTVGSGSVELRGWTYGEAANEPTTFSFTNDSTKATFQYKAKDAEDSTYTDTAPTAAGDYTVKATFPASGNYDEVSVTADFTIAARGLTVAGLAVADKTYDGTTAATIEGTPTLEGAVEGDDVALVNGTATFSAATAGKNVPVTFAGFSLTGEDAANYTLVRPAGATGTIIPAELTITGATVAEKAYDGTADAKVTGVSFSGLVAGESLAAGADYTVSGAMYDSANATGEGAATKVNFSVALADTATARNYVLVSASGEKAATIKKATTSGYAVSDAGKAGQQNSCRVYVVDGGVVTVNVKADANHIFHHELSYENGSLRYDLVPSATEGQTATVLLTVQSANYEDYVIKATLGVTTKTQVEIDVKAGEYTYNGGAQTPTDIKVEGNKVAVDSLVKTYVGIAGTDYTESTVAPKAAGTYLMMVEVPDSDQNYDGFGFCTFEIEPKALTATALAQSKPYDGTTAATVTGVSVDGRVGSDEVIAQATGGSFADKNVGENKTVTVSYELLGKDAGNYSADAMVETKASITPKELTVVASAKDKTYDGTTDADAGVTLSGAVSGEDVTAAVTSASFADKNVGAGKDVTVGVALAGADAANYTAASTATATATIAAKQISIAGATVADKTYDGTIGATVTAVDFDGLVEGESLAAGTDYSVYGARYDGANATGDGEATKVGFSVKLTDTDAAKNYALVSAEGSQAATIGKIEVICPAIQGVGLRGSENTLDLAAFVVGGGTVTVDGVADANGILDGEPTFDDGILMYTLKDTAADGQQAAVTLKVTSANYEDYDLVATLAVWPKEKVAIMVSDDSASYTYDGSAQAPSGISVEDDAVEVGDLVVTYTGTDGTVYGPGAQAPTAAGSYLMTVAVADTNLDYCGSATCAFQIAKKAVGVKGLAVANKVYDGTAAATIAGTPELDGAVEGDDVALACGVPSFTSAAVGENVPVAFTDFSLTGASAANYELTQPAGVTASIRAYKATGAEYSATTGDWTNQDFTVTAAEGWKVSLSNAADADWKGSLTCSDEGADSLTFYVRNEAEGYISEAVALGHKIDKTAPSGEVRIGDRNAWREFVSKITFGLFFKESQVVTITGSDALSGVASVGYLVTDEDLTVGQLAGREFTAYGGAFGIEPDARLIVYARVADKAGNVTYLRSDGVVLDATAPVIAGAENGRTYCGAVELTVADDNLASVTANGATVELANGKLTVAPAEGTQVVEATDKAGNSATLALTVNDGHAWGAWVSNGDGTHTRTCKYNASHVETASCHGGAATCSARAVCDDCGHEYGVVDPSNHADLKHVAAKAATATADGNAEYWYCTACGKYYSDAAAAKEIRKSDTVVPKTGDDGEKDDSSSKSDGNGKSDANKPGGQSSTDSANGSQAGASKPAAGGAKVPATGDPSEPAWPAALLGAAAIGAAFVFAKKKRSE